MTTPPNSPSRESTSPPPGQAPGKREAVEAMFDDIAPRYDLLNRILSFGIDQIWRDRAIAWLEDDRPRRILDVATGTGDLAIKALDLEPDAIVGVDISEEMLVQGRRKVERIGRESIITLRRGDAARLPFSDRQFDAALVAFGVRNFENLQDGLREIRRVLKPGGALVVLEFSHPTAFPIKQAYSFYSHVVLPVIGRLLSNNSAAYEYLPASVDVFPSGDAFRQEMRDAGYEGVLVKPLTFGIASLYKGRRAR
ncbi:MAG: bifunctional demethylmenaquinone methyltransferase/2-methoxy-6-polyprenyl-1,4-benzoquinol methylase UbiE [Rhodothermales bacterium]